MNFSLKNMGGTYTILGSIFQIAAIICFAVVYFSDKNKDSVKPVLTPSSNNTYNIQGDYVNRDKTVKTDKIKKVQKSLNSSPTLNKGEIIINNGGIVNSGVNNGTQTVNNYNERQPRKLNSNDINDIKNTIPKEYNVIISFVNSTEEAINYTNQIISELKTLNYRIIEINSIGVLADGRPYAQDERYYINVDISNKKAEIVIKEQK